MPLASMPDHRKDQIETKIERLKIKIDLFTSKTTAVAEAVLAKRIGWILKQRMFYPLMWLLDARRLHDHQFTEKAINSQETKKKMIPESYNQGFTALPGFALEALWSVVYGCCRLSRWPGPHCQIIVY
jgi:hypothetical protein